MLLPHVSKIFLRAYHELTDCKGQEQLLEGKEGTVKSKVQHATFITGQELPGLLSDTAEDRKETGFLAFLRLIGTLYYKKYYASMVSLKGVQTPQQLLHAQETDPNSPKKFIYSGTIE